MGIVWEGGRQLARPLQLQNTEYMITSLLSFTMLPYINTWGLESHKTQETKKLTLTKESNDAKAMSEPKRIDISTESFLKFSNSSIDCWVNFSHSI